MINKRISAILTFSFLFLSLCNCYANPVPECRDVSFVVRIADVIVEGGAIKVEAEEKKEQSRLLLIFE